ncbi:parapinopsin-like, partial [Littorina saxatilis]|uniref:parapinopsin-like n=1 Tax=Littorina saxatilis TaxID=31220 RepID=UPI0038B43BC1
MSNVLTMTSTTEITTINRSTPTEFSPHSLRHSMSDTGYVTIAVLLSVVWVFGTVFNITALYVFFSNKRLQSPTNMFVIALSLCDLCMSFIGTFMAMTSSWKKHWLYGHNGCVFEGFTVYFLGLTSVYLLTAISLDRYIVIARPLIGHLITHKMACVSIALCWLGGFLWAAAPLFGWNEFRLEGAGVSCSVVWESTNPTYTSYIFVIFTFCLVIPLALMVFSYYHVFMTIRLVT